MKLSKKVSMIFGGVNRTEKKRRHTSNDDVLVYNVLTRTSINTGFVNKNELVEDDSLTNIDHKYLTKENDIVISSKEPFNVVLISSDDENILVDNNFVILRDSEIDVTFLYNYLKIMGKKMKSLSSQNLTKAEIEDIEIPDSFNDKKIEKIAKITKRLNNRQKGYGTLLDNDEELIKLIYEKESRDYE